MVLLLLVLGAAPRLQLLGQLPDEDQGAPVGAFRNGHACVGFERSPRLTCWRPNGSRYTVCRSPRAELLASALDLEGIHYDRFGKSSDLEARLSLMRCEPLPGANLRVAKYLATDERVLVVLLVSHLDSVTCAAPDVCSSREELRWSVWLGVEACPVNAERLPSP